jgi:hypothetical protein
LMCRESARRDPTAKLFELAIKPCDSSTWRSDLLPPNTRSYPHKPRFDAPGRVGLVALLTMCRCLRPRFGNRWRCDQARLHGPWRLSNSCNSRGPSFCPIFWAWLGVKTLRPDGTAELCFVGSP